MTLLGNKFYGLGAGVVRWFLEIGVIFQPAIFTPVPVATMVTSGAVAAGISCLLSIPLAAVQFLEVLPLCGVVQILGPVKQYAAANICLPSAYRYVVPAPLSL